MLVAIGAVLVWGAFDSIQKGAQTSNPSSTEVVLTVFLFGAGCIVFGILLQKYHR